MIPMKALRLALGELLAADVPTLAPVAANEIVLIAADFTPDENLTIGTLTLASFTGSAAKGGVAGAQQVGIDPPTGDQVITNLAPVGGWRWECTAAPTPAQSIYGYALTDSTGATLLAVEKFDSPIIIAQVGDFIDLGAVTLNFVAEPIA